MLEDVAPGEYSYLDVDRFLRQRVSDDVIVSRHSVPLGNKLYYARRKMNVFRHATFFGWQSVFMT